MIKYVDCTKEEANLDNLYSSRTCKDPHKINVVFKDDIRPYDLILDARDNEPDCKISSFKANIYFRTRNGINKKRYASIKAIEKAVRNVSKKYGLELDYLKISKGEPATI